MTESTWWDEEFDVVVAGGGGAGLMTAVEAADRGASVLLVEKQPAPGGATAMAVGSITAAGTALQRAAGIEDDTENHFADLLAMVDASGRRDQVDLELSRLMVERAPAALQRLTELGVKFSGPHPETPHKIYRMHNVLPETPFIETLAQAAATRGVTIRTDTVIQELQQDESGAVSSICLRQGRGHQSRAVHVRRGVVLATGDFSANDELARAHGRPPAISAIDPLRSYATGDGIVLAMALGAAAVGLNRSGGPNFRTVLPPYCAPERSLLREGGVLINRLGRRYTNELETPELSTNEQPGKTAHLVFDSRLAARVATADEDSSVHSRDGWYRKQKLFLSTFPGVAYGYLDDYRTPTEYFFEADSLDGLARKLDLDPAAFTESIGAFNRAAAGQHEDEFGRKQAGTGVATPPFYAIGPIKPFNIFSAGGLTVDSDMHVLDQQGRPIPHLYAAGVNAEGGVFLGGHGHHLAWAFGTGMIAGANAAAEAIR